MDWTEPVSPFFPPFPAISAPFSSPGVGEGERRGQGWINMHAGGNSGGWDHWAGAKWDIEGRPWFCSPSPPSAHTHTH